MALFPRCKYLCKSVENAAILPKLLYFWESFMSISAKCAGKFCERHKKFFAQFQCEVFVINARNFLFFVKKSVKAFSFSNSTSRPPPSCWPSSWTTTTRRAGIRSRSRGWSGPWPGSRGSTIFRREEVTGNCWGGLKVRYSLSVLIFKWGWLRKFRNKRI